MEQTHQSPHPQWALSHKKQGTELRCINNRYYLYEYKTVYDPVRKRAKKISGKLPGTITRKYGFVPSATRIANTIRNIEVSMPVTVKEKYFPEHWKVILAIAYCRFVYRCPLKNIPFRLGSSYMPEHFQLPPFNEKTSSMVLGQVGKMQANMKDYMKSFIKIRRIRINGRNKYFKSFTSNRHGKTRV